MVFLLKENKNEMLILVILSEMRAFHLKSLKLTLTF